MEKKSLKKLRADRQCCLSCTVVYQVFLCCYLIYNAWKIQLQRKKQKLHYRWHQYKQTKYKQTKVTNISNTRKFLLKNFFGGNFFQICRNVLKQELKMKMVVIGRRKSKVIHFHIEIHFIWLQLIHFCNFNDIVINHDRRYQYHCSILSFRLSKG